MITEIVRFALPPNMSREELLGKYRKTVDHWSSNPDLIRKHYFFDSGNGRGGGVYLWRDRAAQQYWHGKEYRELVRTHYGSEPEIECFDTMIIVDNEKQTVSEVAPERG